MRRILTLVAVATALWSSQLLAAPSREDRDRGSRSFVELWARPARLTATDLASAVQAAALTDVNGSRPLVLLETNYYTFLPDDPLQLRVTLNPNGFTAPVTLYLYWENRVTGARRYYNASSKALLPTGTVSDLFGSTGSPVAVIVPSLFDFVLFGTATDPSTIGFGVNGALGGSIATPAGQTGQYQYVMEVRDAAGKRVLSRSNAMYSYIDSSVPVSGTISASTTWTANKRYVLSDFVTVAAGITLTIEPGTVVYGGNGRATLFIQRGAKIMAEGTARRPIIMTSPLRTGSRHQKDWGSLILLGKGIVNEPGGQLFYEGTPSLPEYQFGGSDNADSSGVLRYVRLEFGGFEFEANKEINGLTLGAVGSGTVIDYVEVLQNKDDAAEFWGGAVNVKHFLGIGFADDGLDFDNGYQGNVQFAVLIKRVGDTSIGLEGNDEEDGNVLTESDNHPTTFTLTPTTNFKVYNVTGVRTGGNGDAKPGHFGAVIRKGSAGKYLNAIITGSKKAPVTVRDDATYAQAAAGELVFDYSILHGDFSDARFPQTPSDRPQATRDFIFTTMKHNRNIDPLLAIGSISEFKLLMPDLAPLAGSPALDADFVAQPPDNGFFEQVDYIGAIGPGNNWVLSGWANFSDN